MSLTQIIKQIYFKSTGYSYPNMGRLFLRLFVGVMLIQFGIRQILQFRIINDIFPAVLGMSSETSLIIMIVIELACSIFIMAGFLTRLMVLPPFVAMILAEYHMMHQNTSPFVFDWLTPGFLPVMFLGIYFFILLVGPGKISVDYFLSLHLLNSEDRNEEEELEVV